MKKRITALSLALFMSLAFLAYAEVNAETAEFESTATVKFESDEDPVDPVDPEDPDTDGGGGGTGHSGSVTLDHVPNLPFGVQKIKGNKFQTTNLKPFIQVSDRSGEYHGYTVTAKLSDFVDTGDATNKFDASIVFTNGEVKTTKDNLSNHPTTPVEFKLDSSTQSAVTVMEAAKDAGRLTFITRWLPKMAGSTNDSVELILGDAPKSGDYSATITWELTFTPNTKTP